MAADDKNAFSERLKTALKRLPKSIETPTDLAHHFNLKHKNDSITPQAAQRWLKGTAIPTADKLQTLADWLNVSAHWLKNGPPPPPKKTLAGKRGQPGQPGQLSEKETRLLAKLRSLSEHQVYIVAELIEQLALEREIWADPADQQ
jgi:transcriptional regulator with XRE-family HTH domain